MAIGEDQLLFTVFGMATAVLLTGMFLHKMKQPTVVAYILAGLALGPVGFAVITSQDALTQLGSLGAIFLAFFIGMEISLPRILERWKVTVFGTVLQIAFSVLVMYFAGHFLGWPYQRSILLGFVISMSSTAIVVKILDSTGEKNTRIGQDALGVLLVQDLALLPMLIIITLMQAGEVQAFDIIKQVVGAIALIGLIIWAMRKKQLSIPLLKKTNDEELYVFAALAAATGLAFFTGILGLSTAIGAFIGGMLISFTKETKWIHETLHPFRVFFTALFFISIGLLIDPTFFVNNYQIVLLTLALALITNIVVNAVVMRMLGSSWKKSWLFGSLHSQIGEFSFVLAAIGLHSGLIGSYGYQVVILVIALSMIATMPIVSITRKLTA